MKNGIYIEPDGTEQWYKDNLTHREDGPAVIYPDGYQMWYQNGHLHREDGPAAIWMKYFTWWLNDIPIKLFYPTIINSLFHSGKEII
jgi:hypothetical protein